MTGFRSDNAICNFGRGMYSELCVHEVYGATNAFLLHKIPVPDIIVLFVFISYFLCGF